MKRHNFRNGGQSSGCQGVGIGEEMSMPLRGSTKESCGDGTVEYLDCGSSHGFHMW